MISKLLYSLTATSFALLLAACTSVTDAPRTLQTQAETNINQAESAGADEHAPLALRNAKQHLDNAEKAMQEEHHEEAKMLLEKAMIDADYAIAKTNSEKSQQAAEQVRTNIQTLEEEIQDR